MNINEIQIGDYVETPDGSVLEVVSKEVVSGEGGFVALKSHTGTFWTTHNKIVKVRNEY